MRALLIGVRLTLISFPIFCAAEFAFSGSIINARVIMFCAVFVSVVTTAIVKTNNPPR
jgi:hypothetical protein